MKKLALIFCLISSFCFGQFCITPPSLAKITVQSIDTLGTPPSNTYDISRMVNYQRNANGSSPDYETILLYQRFTTPPAFPSYTDMSQINDFVAGIKSDYSITTLRTTFDFIHFECLHTQQAANLNWVYGNSAYDLTTVNSPTWTADVAYTGASTKYLKTGLNYGSGTHKFSLNSATLGIYLLDNIAEASFHGSYNGSQGDYIGPRIVAGTYNIALNDNIGMIATIATSAGLTVAYRTGSTSMAVYKNGTSIATSSNLATTLVALEVYLLAANSSGSASFYSTNRLCFDYTGSSAITPSAISTRANTFLTYKGINVY